MAEVYSSEMLQVISNLVVNALDALPPNGTLCVRIRRQQGKVRFLIADNGHGIPAEHAQVIFPALLHHQGGKGHRSGPGGLKENRGAA